MKTEGDFNAALSKQFRKAGIFAIKVADKFTIGISDFLILHNSVTLALECKFISEWPSDRAQLLKHPFTGEQLTFMESVRLAGHRAIGLVAVKEAGKMILIESQAIPESGNWNTGDFRGMSRISVPWLETQPFLEWRLLLG